MSTVLKNTVVPLYFNSRDRIDIKDSTTDFTIQLRKDLRNISTIQVSNVGIPRTYTNINVNNNLLIVTFRAGVDVITMNIVVDEGEYTHASLADAVQAAFTNDQTSTNTIGLDWTVAYNDGFFNIAVQYDQGASITWEIAFTYTPMVDILGIGEGGTTETSFSTENNDFLEITTGRRSSLGPIHFAITSKALTGNINTSYISSLAKSFTVNDDNCDLIVDIEKKLVNHTNQITLGSDAVGEVFLGQSVDISGNGNVCVAGAYGDRGRDGTVYTYIRQSNGVDFIQQTITSAFNPTTSNARFGYSVGIARDGLTMIVGAPYDDTDGNLKKLGAAYIFTWTGTQWSQQIKIQPTDAKLSDDQELGEFVAISGDGLTAAASSRLETVLYVKSEGKWQLSRIFSNVEHPRLNYDGSILTINDLFSIYIWEKTDSWTQIQSIATLGRIVRDISDDGKSIAMGGTNLATVFTNTGTYVEDAGMPVTKINNTFGGAVSISGDGNTLAVGDSDGSVTYIFNKDVAWTENSDSPLESKDNGLLITSQGISVALSTTGDTLAVGAPLHETGKAVTWSFNSIIEAWEEPGSNPLSPAGASSDAEQGAATSISGRAEWMITGGGSLIEGAAWIYKRDGSVWTQFGDKLTGDGIINDEFGAAVAMSRSGTTAIVGMPGRANIGGALIFAGDTWAQQGTVLIGAPSAASQRQGQAVAIDELGDTVVIGMEGGAFVFVRNAGVWSQQAFLQHSAMPDPINDQTQGRAVAISADGNTIAVGAPGPTNVVAIYNRSGVTWTEYPTVLVNTVFVTDFFISVALSADGKTLAVGEPDDPSNVVRDGYVTVWTFSGTWTVQDSFSATPTGASVSLSEDGNVLAIGAVESTALLDRTSSVYIYTRSGSTWTQYDHVVGEKRTDNNDVQGESVSVAYLDDAKTNFLVAFGGSGARNSRSGNWSYISNGTFNVVETIKVPPRAYTIFDLMNTLNSISVPDVAFTYTFNDGIVTMSISGVNSTFKINTASTFNIFEFIDTALSVTKTSNEIDLSIGNNIIKVVDISQTPNEKVYDVHQDLLFRKYEAGYTIPKNTPIDIQLRDERDRVVDLGGVDWIMTVYATIHN